MRDRHDHVVVQEKLDGSCVAVARLDGGLHALTRSGNPASGSRFEHHRLFAAWVRVHDARLRALLAHGERVVGEWLALAHGTRYALPHEPFVAFYLMTGGARVTHDELTARADAAALTTPRVLSSGPPALDLLPARAHRGRADLALAAPNLTPELTPPSRTAGSRGREGEPRARHRQTAHGRRVDDDVTGDAEPART